MAGRNFERALRSAARRGRTPDVCPDAAMLAAYVDRSLSTEEHAMVEAHVADCSACLEHLALVAALDAPEESPVSASTFDLGRMVRRWGWLVPAMTAVLVVAVWIRSSDERASVAPASAPATMSARPAENAQVKPEPQSSPIDRSRSLSDAGKLQAKRDSASTAVGRKKTKAPARREGPESRLAETVAPASPTPPAEAERGDANRMATLAAADEKGKEADTMAATPPPAAVADARERAVAKVASEPIAGGARATAGMLLKTARQESAGTGMVRVRIASGRIDRSTDGGQSWTSEHSGVTDRIQVTSCPTTTACWLGADNGVVFVRTTNGDWVRRAVPPPAAAVQRIVAIDHQHATVELSDGRRFVTANGGVTWTVPPPQP